MKEYKSILDLQEEFLEEIEKMGEIVSKDYSEQICSFIEEDLNEACKNWEIRGTMAFDPNALYPDSRTIVCMERNHPKTGEPSIRIQLMIKGEVVWTIYVEKYLIEKN